MNIEEETFVRKALASVERAEKIQNIRRIVLMVLAFAGAGWLASTSPSAGLNVSYIELMGVALIAAICTSKIMSLVNRNTKAVLQAIADLPRR